MYEVLAVTLGVLMGLGFSSVRPAARAVLMIVPLGIVVGAAVSALAGEIELSLGFLVFDTVQVTASALLVYVLGRAVRAARPAERPAAARRGTPD
jgi:hypothetical protein